MLHGCHAFVFFIHGRKIREQRQVPQGRWTIAQLHERLEQWSAELPNARLVWTQDTGDGDSGLWIEGEREPNEADWQRLREARAHQRRRDEEELARIQRRLDAHP
jgi:hypothetical protein